MPDPDDRARLAESPRVPVEGAEALAAVGRLLVESLDVDVVARRIVDGLRRLLHAPAGSLYRVDPTSDDLVALAVSGDLGQTGREPLVLARGTGIAGLAVREARPVASENVLTDPRLTHTAETYARIEREAYRAALSVPLRIKGRVIGTLSVGDRPGRVFGPPDVRLAEALADHAALGLENARLYEEADERRREAEGIAEALRQSNEMLEALIRSSALGIVVLDRQARVRLWNQAAEVIFGWTADEAGGRFLPIVPPENREEFLENLGVSLSGGVYRTEVTRQRKDGSPVDLRVSTAPLRDAERRITGVVTVLEDITERKRAEASLGASEARYRAIVESQTELVCRFMPDGTLSFVNDAYCRYFGKSREELIGRGYAPMVHPDDLPRVQAVLGSLGPESRLVSVENRVIRQGGEIRWMRWTSRALYDEHGRFFELQSVGRDVTESRQVAAAQRVLAEASRLLVSSLDYETTLMNVARLAVPDLADWCAVDLIDAAGALTRLAVAHADPTREPLARELHRRYPPWANAPHGAPEVLRTGRSALYTELSEAKLAAFAHDAEQLTLWRRIGVRSAICVPLVARGRTIGLISFAAAESGRRYGAADLALAEALAGRAALAVENARLYRETEAASRAKDQFLATLAHELRNPLASIVNALQALDQFGPQSAEVNDLRTIIARQTRHLAHLVDDLLDVSRVSSGKIVLKRRAVDLRQVAERSLESLEASGRGQFHEVSFVRDPDPVVVDGDPIRLEQVLGNLLDNAVKYSPAGGPIRVTVRREDGQAVVRVQDRGVGVAADMLEVVFQPFAQADTSLDRPTGGLGLGLAVVRGLVEQHGGRIVAESAGLGQGTEFVVRLPLATALTVASSERAPVAAGPARHVVLVEDYADARDALRMVLSLDGHRVETAADGHQGLALILQARPEVALVDIGLPGLDGYEIARRVRAVPEGKRVRLIALTGYGQAYDRRRAMEAGFDMHLVKPVDLEELSRVLARIDSEQSAA